VPSSIMPSAMDSSQPPRKLYETIIMVSAKLFARTTVSLIDNNCSALYEFMRSMLVLHQEAPSDSFRVSSRIQRQNWQQD
jgi:hypothetical protein